MRHDKTAVYQKSNVLRGLEDRVKWMLNQFRSKQRQSTDKTVRVGYNVNTKISC